jgi:conjugal transfer mating pair stabilization protein TraG
MRRAERDYGSTSIENIERAATDIAALRTGTAEEQNALNKDIQGFIASRYNTLDNEQDGNRVLQDKAIIQNRVTGSVGEIRRQAGTAAASAVIATQDNSYDDSRQSIAGPTDHAQNAANSRRGAISAAYDDNGAFDFGSNSLKQIGRDLARPMVPQPATPDARTIVGGPSDDIKGPTPHTPSELNDNLPSGISTLGNGAGGSNKTTWEIDSESLKRLDELSKQLDGK